MRRPHRHAAGEDGGADSGVLDHQADGGTLVAGIPLPGRRPSTTSTRPPTACGASSLAGLLAVGAAGAVVAWCVVRRGLRPIDQMIGTAERIADGELSARVDRPRDRHRGSATSARPST